jgi:hypothetical protein
MSPDWSEDPFSIPYADTTDPQSLNLYSYGANDPLSNIDTDGHDPQTCVSYGAGGQDCKLDDANKPCDNCTVNGDKITDLDATTIQVKDTLLPLPTTFGFPRYAQLRGPVRQQVTIGAAPNLKFDYCVQQAVTGAAKDLTGLSLIDDLSNALAGNYPSGLDSASDAADVAKRGAESLTKSAVAQATIRQALRREGAKVSVKAVGRTASKFGKVAGGVGLGLTALSAAAEEAGSDKGFGSHFGYC